MQDNVNKEVILQCFNEKNKLRVKIISHGFNNQANCQFPKDIRKEGRKYSVLSCFIKLVKGPNGKYFYRVSSKNDNIKILSENDIINMNKNIKIYEDKDIDECLICMSNKKNTVCAPCGHYYACNICLLQMNKCALCRCDILLKIDRNQLDI